MSRSDRLTGVDLVPLLDALREQSARVESLEAEVRLLRATDASPAPVAPELATTPASKGRTPVARRRLLQGGFAAGAALAGAVMMEATSASAAQGGAAVLGQVNDSGGGTTEFDAAIGNGNPAVTARNTNNGPGLAGYSANSVGLQGWGGTASGSGVQGFGGSPNGTGVQGTGTGFGVGVQGVCDAEVGVLGQSTSGTGVAATSDSTAFSAVSSHGLAGIFQTQGTGAQLWLQGPVGRQAPATDAVPHLAGEVLVDSHQDLWACTVSGTPGVWRKLAGPATAGSFHVLLTPARVYDSRPGTTPSQGPKTPLAANTARTLDLTVNNSTVPAGATAAMVNVLLVNAAVGNGNFTVWANGTSRPLANTLVWGGNAQRFSTLAVTALDNLAKVQVLASNTTDLVLDVVGYYR